MTEARDIVREAYRNGTFSYLQGYKTGILHGVLAICSIVALVVFGFPIVARYLL